MKIFKLQTMWSSAGNPAHKKTRYFKTDKGARKAQKKHERSVWCIGTRVVEVKVED